MMNSGMVRTDQANAPPRLRCCSPPAPRRNRRPRWWAHYLVADDARAIGCRSNRARPLAEGSSRPDRPRVGVSSAADRHDFAPDRRDAVADNGPALAALGPSSPGPRVRGERPPNLRVSWSPTCWASVARRFSAPSNSRSIASMRSRNTTIEGWWWPRPWNVSNSCTPRARRGVPIPPLRRVRPAVAFGARVRRLRRWHRSRRCAAAPTAWCRRPAQSMSHLGWHVPIHGSRRRACAPARRGR